ncbi:hypothetical protein WOLCODRAFT_137372 [Wolfiporia cocos MD-104 SS10]|uniref:DUF2423 domain-containing protein n=1 Tax=Wolfiporia cocos (strain MD-104) TaxID=742152 RepID=A0A2H3JGU6_WOLCO|nr:hypothetical protein WOLCODRAFT_137372 [Wolfiporia cocos MD-104 SS10]
MAKSTRSKVKRSFRAKKRTESVYAAAEAARLHRLSQKLKVITTSKTAEDDESPEEEAGVAERDQSVFSTDAQNAAENTAEGADAMKVDSGAAGPSTSTDSSKRVPTHGRRHSRNQDWRLSKGMPARPGSKGMNRQGGIAARRKAGRAHRRR